MRIPPPELFLALFLCARPAAGAVPLMSLEEVDVDAGKRTVDVKVFLTVEAEVPPLFLLGVRWEAARLQFLEVNWRGTIFEASEGPPFHRVQSDPAGEPVAGLYTVGFCDPCTPAIPAGSRIPIANLRFARLPGLSGEDSTAVRLVRAPPLGAGGDSMEPHLYVNGWVKVETADGRVRLHQSRPFLRGDFNLDGTVDLSDPVGTLAALFLGEGSALCPDAADSNDDGLMDVADPIHALSFLFTGGAAPPAPSPAPGLDPTADSLGCDDLPCHREKLVFEEDPDAWWDFVEFCIPNGDSFKAPVAELYPEVYFLPEIAGRIGCGPEEVLCVIAWPSVEHWKICALSLLPFIREIRGSYFE